ncbi:hypothetical protein GCM10010336_55070 [Streptomyces goshikiensis]|nr:hypothetical protein GCM10010336_55070 [Streptomyces goshikiensis]
MNVCALWARSGAFSIGAPPTPFPAFPPHVRIHPRPPEAPPPTRACPKRVRRFRRATSGRLPEVARKDQGPDRPAARPPGAPVS